MMHGWMEGCVLALLCIIGWIVARLPGWSGWLCRYYTWTRAGDIAIRYEYNQAINQSITESSFIPYLSTTSYTLLCSTTLPTPLPKYRGGLNHVITPPYSLSLHLPYPPNQFPTYLSPSLPSQPKTYLLPSSLPPSQVKRKGSPLSLPSSSSFPLRKHIPTYLPYLEKKKIGNKPRKYEPIYSNFILV